MKRKLLIISMLCVASAAWATLVTDDFNRADTALSADTSLIGSHWQQDGATNTWQISGNMVANKAIVQPAIMYNDELQTLNGGGDSFALSLDVSSWHDSIWTGVAFNYNNPSNYYVVRFKTGTAGYQLLGKRNSGSWNVMVNTTAASNFLKDTVYTISVASDTAYTYDFSITQEGGAVMASGTDIFDDESLSTGGYAGLSLDTDGLLYGQYDNFSLEVIPEPATLGLMGFVGAAAFFIRKRFMI